jgi:N-methylhydantoinase B
MYDIIEVEVFNKLFASIAEEMGIVLGKSSFSPNIKERRDFSCAIFDRQGELVAQAAHIPVHLGAMPMTMQHVLAAHVFRPGDIIIVNDPYHGGSHLPDITLIEAVSHGTADIHFYVAARAHHADVGGKMPASMGMLSDIAAEGILIPPTLLYSQGIMNRRFVDTFLQRVENPTERLGDLRAQTAALHRGKTRLTELVERYGMSHVSTVMDQLKDYGERLMRGVIEDIPDGLYHFSDYLDDDGISGKQVKIEVHLTIKDSEAQADFTDCDAQVSSPFNTVKAVAHSALVYVFQCLLGSGYPINHGTYRPLSCLTRLGTLLDARPPAPVAAGNVETSQRIVDVLLGALAQALPQRIPAASCGSMNNVAISGVQGKNEGRPFSYYETIGGGMGARPTLDGLSGIHTHMTNTMNTPIEALELAYPLEVTQYGLRRNTGGSGRYKGGDGIIRSYLFLTEARVSLLTERRKLKPYGLAGGNDGSLGTNVLIRKKRRIQLAGKANFRTRPGDMLVISTPAGGGWGYPSKKNRPPFESGKPAFTQIK